MITFPWLTDSMLSQYPKFKEDTFELDGTDYILNSRSFFDKAPVKSLMVGELPIYFTAMKAPRSFRNWFSWS